MSAVENSKILSFFQAYEAKTGRKVTKCGIFVNKRSPYIACSPDGIIENGQGLVEVKCPWSIRNLPPNSPDALKKPSYRGMLQENELKLKKSHKYYYQIQWQCYVYGASYCDFVIYTLCGINVERISHDTNFSKELAKQVEKCYKSVYIPEYFEHRIPRKLQPFSIEMV